MSGSEPAQAAQQNRRDADELFRAGRQARSQGDDETALEDYTMALRLYEEVPGCEIQQAKCSLNAGVIHRSHGRYQLALDCSRKALALFRKGGGSAFQQAKCYLNRGVAHRSLSNYHQALCSYDQALNLFMEADQDTTVQSAKCYLNMGVVLRAIGEYDTALECYQEALKGFRRSGSAIQQAKCYLNIGVALSGLRHLDDALESYRQALTLFEDIDEDTTTQQAKCYLDIGVAYARKEEYRAAIASYDQALSRFVRAGRRTATQQAKCLLNAGIASRSLGDFETSLDRLRSARHLLDGLPREARVCDTEIARTLLQCADKPGRTKDLVNALMLAVPAAIGLEEMRFQFPSPHQRANWVSNRATSAMNLTLILARRTHNASLISDLVAQWRTVGILDISPQEISRGSTERTPLRDADDFGLTVTEPIGEEHEPTPSDTEEPGSFIAGPTESPGITAHSTLLRRSGPVLIMPDGRPALSIWRPQADRETHSKQATYR